MTTASKIDIVSNSFSELVDPNGRPLKLLTANGEAIDTKDAALRKVLQDCALSTKMMAKTFFPERFNVEFSPLHDEICELIDNPHKYTVIAAPRGIGKTSLVALAYAARHIIFRLCNFIVLVSTTFENAQLQTNNLKMELLSNKAIRDIFGSPKGGKLEGGIEEQFSQKAWVAYQTLILPRGSGQQIRGLLYRNSRPDRFIMDDLEDPETIGSDEIRLKRKEWFNADVMKAVSRTDKNYKFIYIDTLKHQDALLQALLEDTTKWKGTRQEICDDAGISNAPDFLSNEEIQEELAYHKAQGILDVFAREFRNLPISGEDAVFRQEYFQDYEEQELQVLEEQPVHALPPIEVDISSEPLENAAKVENTLCA